METYDEKRQQWPVRVSPKLDGVFARATAAGVLSKGGHRLKQPELEARLKPFFQKHPEVALEGELFRRGAAQEVLQSRVMAGKRVPFVLHPQEGPRPKNVRMLRESVAQNAKEAQAAFKKAVAAGNEGVVMRGPDGTRRKLKPFSDSEYEVARVIGGPRNVLELVGGGKVQARSGLQVAAGQQVTVRHSGVTRRGRPKAGVAERVRERGL